MKWRRFIHQGDDYSLSHLNPFYWNYTVEANSTQPECIYKFQVTFSMHCFTRDPLNNEQIAEDLWYEGPKEKRVFCFDRYDLSSQLPAIIKSLGNRPCWHTHHGNYFTIEQVTKEGENIEYEAYFDVTRASRNGWLNLVVQTAYVRTDDYVTTQPKKRKIRLSVIARNTTKGIAIRPGR